jgi:hypothetical protein
VAAGVSAAGAAGVELSPDPPQAAVMPARTIREAETRESRIESRPRTVNSGAYWSFLHNNANVFGAAQEQKKKSFKTKSNKAERVRAR